MRAVPLTELIEDVHEVARSGSGAENRDGVSSAIVQIFDVVVIFPPLDLAVLRKADQTQNGVHLHYGQ